MKQRLIRYIAALLLSLAANPVSADLDKGLFAYYPLDLDTKDASGNEHHGIEKGSLGYVPGKIGQAAQFDGSSYIEIPDTSDFMFANESLTFSAWVQIVDNSNYRPFIALSDTDQYPGITLAKSRSGYWSGKIYWQVLDGTKDVHAYSMDNGNALSKNKWIHLTGTIDYDKKVMGLYVDGILQQHSQLINFDLSQATSLALRIGAYNHHPHKHNGLIDEVRIYRRLLSDCEIQSLYKGSDVCDTVGVGSGCTPEEFNTAYQQGFEAGIKTCDGCQPATLSYDFRLHIPLLHYSPLADDKAIMPLSVDMLMKDYNQLLFGVSGYEVIE